MKTENSWEEHTPSRNLDKHDVEKRGYSPKYDAYYNFKTGEWLEKTCGHEDCEFCKDRPEKYIKPKA